MGGEILISLIQEISRSTTVEDGLSRQKLDLVGLASTVLWEWGLSFSDQFKAERGLYIDGREDFK